MGCDAWAATNGLRRAEPAAAAGYARAVAATDVQALLAELQEWARSLGVVTHTHSYGPGPEHEGDLLLPAGDGPHRVAVLLHGGFWRAPFKRSLMDAMAIDLARRGRADVERRVRPRRQRRRSVSDDR